MIDAEILFPVTCPVCAQQALTGFRTEVVIDAVLSGQIRLYSTCHLAAWDASDHELAAILDFLDTVGADATGETQYPPPVFVHTGIHDRLAS
jgi:hypothetical protein